MSDENSGLPPDAVRAAGDLIPADLGKFEKKFAKDIAEIVRGGFSVQTKVRMFLNLILPLWTKIQQLGQELREQKELVSTLAFYSEEKARESERDQKTGLLLLEPFRMRVTMYFRAEKRAVRVVYAVLDLTRFKQVNDTYGHAVGDIALNKVADVLRSLYETHPHQAADEERKETRRGPFDVACRAGGDEFHFLVTDVASIEDCRRMTRRICREVAAIEVPQVGYLNLGVDIGAVYLEHDPQDLHDAPQWLVRQASRTADFQAYQAKRYAKDKERKGQKVELDDHCGVRTFTTKGLLAHKPFKKEPGAD